MRLFLLSTVAGGLPWEGIGASGAGCGPAPEAVFGAMVSRMLDQSVAESDEPLKITISGADQAPNLRRYLESQGVTLTLSSLSEDAARAAVQSRAVPVVIIVPRDYASRFAAAMPAPLLLVADSAGLVVVAVRE